MSTATSPLNKSAEPTTWNFKLLAQNDLGGFGGVGEGMAIQKNQGWSTHPLVSARIGAKELYGGPRPPTRVI